MSFKISRKKGGTTDKLLQNLEALDNLELNVGHFASSGSHSSDSDILYTELMALYALGVVDGQPVRNPLAVLNAQVPKLLRDPQIAQALAKWSMRAHMQGSEDALMEEVGSIIRTRYKAIFGSVGPMMPADSTGTPMLETGELRDAAAYKINQGPVKEN